MNPPEEIPDAFTPQVYNEQFGYFTGHYLDHAGAALYPRGLVAAISNDLCENFNSNPHSNKHCVEAINNIRQRVLHHFNTDVANYSVIFTSGATEAIKIVADTFDYPGITVNAPIDLTGDRTGGDLLYLDQNHTSVLGMRNVDNIKKNNVPVKILTKECVIGLTFERQKEERHSRFDIMSKDERDVLMENLRMKKMRETPRDSYRGNSLFVYPAQCNFSGYKYPLSWIRQVQTWLFEDHPENPSRWSCFLDAAAFVSSSELNLGEVQPDFLCISFYKIFGIPTGLGALIVRNASAHVLNKQYFGGGTVQIALTRQPIHVPKAQLHERFEDGTVNFQAIIALGHALDWFQNGGLTMHVISEHCFRLTQYLYKSLKALHHHNNMPGVVIYADTQFSHSSTQGPIVNFNLLNDDGSVAGYNRMMEIAAIAGIHLRAGCFCNPGACQKHLRLCDSEYLRFYSEAGHVCGDYIDVVNGMPTGSVRASVGYYTRKCDIDMLYFAIRDYLHSLPPPVLPLIPNVVNNVPMNVDGQVDQLPMDLYLMTPTMRLTEIYVYPIKSCRGMAVCSWTLGNRGLLYDRYWMIVNSSGVSYTLKSNTELSRIEPFVDLERGLLVINCAGYNPCTVPLEIQGADPTTLRLCQSRVCGDQVVGIDCGDEVNAWLNKVLRKTGLRLIRLKEDAERMVSTGQGPRTSVALSNQSQYLIINEKSVTWLMDSLPPDCDFAKDNFIQRFRSNFVFDGNCPALQEEHWDRVVIGETDFWVTGVCNRCSITCIDPVTGARSREPYVTLHNHFMGYPKFGVYLAKMTRHEVVLRVGDKVIPFLK